jgi:hypothetical protein
MKRLRTLKSFQIFKTELKNLKPMAVDVLFYAYPMVPLSCRSNLAGWYLCVFALRKGTSFPLFCKQKYLVFSLKSRGSNSLQVQGKLSSCFYFTLKLPAQAPQHKECNSVFVARHTALLYVNRQGKDTQLFLVHGIEVG